MGQSTERSWGSLSITTPPSKTLLVFSAASISLGLSFKLLQLSAKRTYYKWLNNPSTPLDVDSFVDTKVNPPKYLKIAFLQKMSVGDRRPSDEVVKLASVESEHVAGLQVTERAEARTDGKGKGKSANKPSLLAKEVVVDPEKPQPLVIGEYLIR